MYIHKITQKEYVKMDNYHNRKKDDTMYNIDDYYYVLTIMKNSAENGNQYISINMSGSSWVVVRRNKPGDTLWLIETSDIEDIKKFTKGYVQIIFSSY